jgi:hypothetical protein
VNLEGESTWWDWERKRGRRKTREGERRMNIIEVHSMEV